jgi:hypothetical protein
MNAESTWNNIIDLLKEAAAEVVTVPSNNKAPLWFNAYVENGDLFVQNSISHKPSTMMSQRRKISKIDFETVYFYYHRWANGERHLRQEVRTLSRNTAYIFALISKYE